MGEAQPAAEADLDAGRGLMDGAAVPAVDPGAAAPPRDACGDTDAELAHARRARLRAAQEVVADAAWRADQALATADRALAAVSVARGALDQFADVGAKIAAHHAGLLRAGGTGQRTVLPPDLAAARAAAFAAELELTDSEAAHDLLSIEARAATGVVSEAGALLRAAADELVRASMLGVMLTVRRAELEAGRGRMMLVGFANTRGLSDPPPWPLTQMLHDPWHSAIADAAGVGSQAAAEQWNDYRRALLTDAAAVFGG